MNCPFGQSMVDEVLAAGTAGTFSGTVIWAGGGEGWVLELEGAGGTVLLNPALVRRLRQALDERLATYRNGKHCKELTGEALSPAGAHLGVGQKWVDEARRTGTQIPAGLAQLDGQLPEWDRQLTAKRQARAMDRPMNRVIAAAFA